MLSSVPTLIHGSLGAIGPLTENIHNATSDLHNFQEQLMKLLNTAKCEVMLYQNKIITMLLVV